MTFDWLRMFSSRVFRVDLASGVVLAVVGVLPLGFALNQPHLVTVLLALVATALRRSTPGVALGVTWVMALSQIALDERPSLVAVTYVLVLYAVARVGNRWEALASGISVVLGGTIASFYLYRSRADESELRIVAETEAHRALDLAAEERARTAMARDVHDIVGHSLAVIIAQADSVEFLDDTDRIRAVNATIAETARRSLREVREVLSGTSAGTSGDEPQDLAALVEQVRAAGVTVDHRVRGERRALDPARSVVVRRVAQEMLTNALRHGAPGGSIAFHETWRSGDVVLEVENATGGPSTSAGGLGIDGMRSRVTAIGGFLEAEALDDVFTARARIPLPATTDAQKEDA
jgi:signal transduction histidine kinase